MEILLWVCFGVGVGYTVIAFLLGEIFHFAGGGHADGGLDGIDAGVDGLDVDGLDIGGGAEGIDGLDTGGADGIGADGGLDGTVSPLKPAVIAAFLTVFGGAGLLLKDFPYYTVLPAAGLLAAIVSFLIYRFIIVPLHKAQNTSAVDIQSLVGSKAVVTEKIFQGGYGQISYKVNGNSYTSPAKAEDGGAIERHSTVEIIYIHKGTYYVKGGI